MTDTERKYFLLGQAVRRSMGAAKTPVAYLYNGVRLPKLPDIELPYATILLRNGVYYLIFTSYSMYTATGTLIPVSNPNYKVDGDEWVSNSSGWGNSHTLIWANYDVCTEADNGGSVFMEASTPIPVYE